MIKKCTEVSPSYIRRRYFHFLIPFLLISAMSQAICKPEDAYSEDNPKQEAPQKIYVSEGTTLFVAEGTIISGAELTNTDSKETTTKILKKKTEKHKVIKKANKYIRPVVSAPPMETTISSKEHKHSWDSSGSHNKQVSITSNSSFKLFAVTLYNTLFAILFLFAIIFIVSYQGYFIKTLLLGTNFQRPPPVSIKY